jgi:hypothetical protein
VLVDSVENLSPRENVQQPTQPNQPQAFGDTSDLPF